MKTHDTAVNCAPPKGDRRRIALAGLANVGKSLVFNQLTKSYSIVANYSQTTTSAVYGEATIGGEKFELIDTPGIPSLWTNTRDEADTREILLNSKADMVLLCGDAGQLKRTLMLLVQLQELGLPTILLLTKSDISARRGYRVDSDRIKEISGVDVLESSSATGLDMAELKKAIDRIQVTEPDMRYSADIESAVNELSGIVGDSSVSRGELLLLLAGSGSGEGILERQPSDIAERLSARLKGMQMKMGLPNIRHSIFGARERAVDRMAESSTLSSGSPLTSIPRRMAWASRHPLFGWPILLAILWATFYGVGRLANIIATWMDTIIFLPLTGWLSSLIGISQLEEFLLGNFGLLTMGVFNAIVTVVPILLIFFLIVNFLEDVGYLPNLSVLANRAFSFIGLTGKSVLPFTLGFGCNTMATITTRMLETRKERVIISALIALGVPCSVQLGVMLAILATAPFSAILIVIGSVVFTQVASGMLMSRYMPQNRGSDFIIELPDFSMPNFGNIARKTYYRIKMFLEEVLPMFIFAALLMFGLDKTGLLAIIKAVMEPIVTGLLSMPDKVTEVFILVISRREVGAVYFKDMVDAGEVGYIQTVVGLIVMTLFIPCMSNTMVMIKELGLKLAIGISVAIMGVAIMVGAVVNMVMRAFI